MEKWWVQYKPVVKALLGKGRQNAIHAQELEALSGVPKERRTHVWLRDVIRALILEDNLPIVASTSHGYWLADSEAEVRRYVASLRRRIAEVRQRANHLEHLANRW